MDEMQANRDEVLGCYPEAHSTQASDGFWEVLVSPEDSIDGSGPRIIGMGDDEAEAWKNAAEIGLVHAN